MNIALPDGADADAACVRRCGAVPAYCALCRRLAAAEAAAERAPAACPALVRRTLFRHRLLELQARAYAAGLLLLAATTTTAPDAGTTLADGDSITTIVRSVKQE